jgi:hypothetical protein
MKPSKLYEALRALIGERVPLHIECVFRWACVTPVSRSW